jgi:hypothetical protein
MSDSWTLVDSRTWLGRSPGFHPATPLGRSALRIRSAPIFSEPKEMGPAGDAIPPGRGSGRAWAPGSAGAFPTHEPEEVRPVGEAAPCRVSGRVCATRAPRFPRLSFHIFESFFPVVFAMDHQPPEQRRQFARQSLMGHQSAPPPFEAPVKPAQGLVHAPADAARHHAEQPPDPIALPRGVAPRRLPLGLQPGGNPHQAVKCLSLFQRERSVPSSPTSDNNMRSARPGSTVASWSPHRRTGIACRF